MWLFMVKVISSDEQGHLAFGLKAKIIATLIRPV